jgi:hypothetical protein
MSYSLQPKANFSRLVLLLATLLLSGCKPRPCTGPLTLTVASVESEKLSHLTPGQELKPGDAAADPAGVLINMDTPLIPLDVFCRTLTDVAGLKLTSRAPLTGRVTVHLDNVTIKSALENILEISELAMVEEDGGIVVMSREDYEALPPVNRVYTITHTNNVLASQVAMEVLKEMESVVTEPTADSSTLTVTAHHRDHPKVSQSLKFINSSERLRLFPPAQLPEKLPSNLPPVELRTAEPDEDGLILYDFGFEFVDPRSVQGFLAMEIGNHERERVVPRRLYNSIMVITTPERMARIASICAYLDDPRWYVVPPDSPQTTPPPAAP